MRFGIFSDVHGNREALEACLHELDTRGYDELIVAGDIVGYGADPSVCLETLRRRHLQAVAGNHDWAALGKMPTESFNPAARIAVAWTSSVLTESQRDYLNSLPLEYSFQEILVVHADPRAPEEWSYIFDEKTASRICGHASFRLIFVGHTHTPFIYGSKGGDQFFTRKEGRYDLDAEWSYIVNTGSVGQPRDGSPLAAAVLVDLERGWIELLRIPYLVHHTMDKIRAAGLPDSLADRLEWGI